MSEIVLSSTNYDYTNGSMMINPGLVQKTTEASTTTGSPSASSFTTDNQHYSTYPGKQRNLIGRSSNLFSLFNNLFILAYAFQPTMSMGYPPVTNYSMSRLGYFKQPNSPESINSSPTPSPPPTASKSSSNNNTNRFNNPTTARVKEMITRANSVPMEFYHTEFLEYSKETYEKKMESKRNKRKRTTDDQEIFEKKQPKIIFEEKEDSEDEDILLDKLSIYFFIEHVIVN